MLYCISANYTPKAMQAMAKNPNTNRRDAVEKLVTARVNKVGQTERAADRLALITTGQRTRRTSNKGASGHGYIYSKRTGVLGNRGLAQSLTRAILKDNFFRAH